MVRRRYKQFLHSHVSVPKTSRWRRNKQKKIDSIPQDLISQAAPLQDESVSDFNATESVNAVDMDVDEADLEINTEQQLCDILCPCTATTNSDVLLMCLAIASRHSLSWTAIIDILVMINNIFNKEVIRPTKYFLMKYLNAGKEHLSYHFYCPECGFYLGTKEEIEKNEINNCCCGISTAEIIKKGSSFFLTVGVEDQLRQLLEDVNISKELDYRFKRVKDESSYEDIYDGATYKKFFKPGGLLWEKYNLSYIFNTDGVPIGKSSKQSMWPIYITINELPPKLRSQHIILAGIYVGKSEPDMNTFLYPFVQQANNLSSKGVKWLTPEGLQKISKVIPICACVDSVARCKMLNMQQFNGYYGCTFCYQKAERTTSGLRYPISESYVTQRTHISTVRDAAKALALMNDPSEKNKTYKGVKGPSPMLSLQHFDVGDGMVPDYMHSVLLGVVRLHTDILLKSVGKEYYVGLPTQLALINERLTSIRPPKTITRTPRSINENKLWKASEWRSWLIFYCVVCLDGILPKKYLDHISFLSSAIYILLQKSISKAELETAQNFILRYVNLFQKYFKQEAMVYNVHLLLHLKKGIENFGPLWTHNTFVFEGENRHLLGMQKNPASVAKEVARKFLVFGALPKLYKKNGASDETLKFCERMCGRKLNTVTRCEDVVLPGKGNQVLPDDLDEETSQCFASLRLLLTSVLEFKKMIFKGTRYTTTSYSCDFKNDDSTILLKNGSSAKIEHIYQINYEEGQKIVLFVREIYSKRSFSCNSHIEKLTGEGKLSTIEPKLIRGQKIAMNISNGRFICNVPYGCHGD